VDVVVDIGFSVVVDPLVVVVVDIGGTYVVVAGGT
jgi:hypothetical protein